jgi:arylsulfatase A-like enzyme
MKVVLNAMDNRFFKDYALWVFGLFLLLVGINFYHALMISPDTVDGRTFQSAILSSPGFWGDLLHFVVGLVLVHTLWLLLLWLSSVGWLRQLGGDRRQRRLLTFLFFLVSALFVLIWSGRSYPNMSSGFLRRSEWLLSDASFYSIACALAVSAVVSLFFLFITQSRLIQKTVVVLSTLCFVAWGGLAFLSTESMAGASAKKHQLSGQPNIFIIGIDSLRPDETGFLGHGKGLTPNVDEFLKNAQTFESAYTPYARTFPAWMSVLTGLEPVHHHGRFNLINHRYLDKSQALGNQLQQKGYHSIFAFDERRFNSMDESFGYDAVVGPKHAAWSFVASGFDHPVVNLLSNTIVGKYLFPGIYLNRGRHGNYDPERFNLAIMDELEKAGDAPIFLTTHFLLPHWPWTSRDVETLEHYEEPEAPELVPLYRYRMMLKQADRQFGEFMAELKSAGYLENSYVFLLSDHGDGFALDADLLEPAVESNAVLETNTRGHATNVFNLGQYRVVLAARDYSGSNKFSPEVKTELSSLMDIYPTVMDLVGESSHDTASVDGISMLATERTDRQLFLETGFSMLELTRDEIDVKDVVNNSVRAYTVDREGRLVVKDNFYDHIMKSKHRAVMEGDWMLAITPTMAQYPVLINRKTKQWWPVDF